MGEELEQLLKVFFVTVVGPWLKQHLPKWVEERALPFFFWTIAFGVIFLWLIPGLIEFISDGREGGGWRVGLNHISRSVRTGLAVVRERFGLSTIEGQASLRVSSLLSIGALFLGAVGRWPYDFYVLMRVLVFVTCIIATFALLRRKPSGPWVGVFVVIALVYNLLLPIHLTRQTWVWLNWVALAAFGLFCLLITPKLASETDTVPKGRA